MSLSLCLCPSPCPLIAPVQRLEGVCGRGGSGGGAAGAPGEAELWAGPDEGAHVLAVVARLRGGAGAGDRPQRPHQVRRDVQQVPARHQGGEQTGGIKKTNTHRCVSVCVRDHGTENMRKRSSTWSQAQDLTHMHTHCWTHTQHTQWCCGDKETLFPCGMPYSHSQLLLPWPYFVIPALFLVAITWCPRGRNLESLGVLRRSMQRSWIVLCLINA